MTMVESLSKQDIAIQFVAFFCMFISFIVFFIQMKKTAAGSRTYHAYTCGIVGFASVAYLFMALGTLKDLYFTRFIISQILEANINLLGFVQARDTLL